GIQRLLDFDDSDHVVECKNMCVRVRNRLTLTHHKHAVELSAQSSVRRSRKSRGDRQFTGMRECAFERGASQSFVHCTNCRRMLDVLTIKLLGFEGQELA